MSGSGNFLKALDLQLPTVDERYVKDSYRLQMLKHRLSIDEFNHLLNFNLKGDLKKMTADLNTKRMFAKGEGPLAYACVTDQMTLEGL